MRGESKAFDSAVIWQGTDVYNVIVGDGNLITIDEPESACKVWVGVNVMLKFVDDWTMFEFTGAT